MNYTRAGTHSSLGLRSVKRTAPLRRQCGKIGLYVPPKPMQLLINGQATEMPAELTARQLIERLELTSKRIALEVNGEIVPRSTYEAHNLREGDKIEIVHAIGGG